MQVRKRENAALYNTPSEHTLRQPDDPFYKRFAAECSRMQVRGRGRRRVCVCTYMCVCVWGGKWLKHAEEQKREQCSTGGLWLA